VDSGGIYFGTLRDTSGCKQFSDTLQVMVNPLPVKLNVLRVHDTLSVTQGFASYQWYFNNATIPGATGYSHIAKKTGKYFVSYSDANGCRNYSDTINIDLTGIDDLERGDVNIFPNPVKNVLNIRLPHEFQESKGTLIVYNYRGQQVLQKNVTFHGASAAVDVSGLKTGIYLLNIDMQKRHYLCRFSVVY